MKKKNSGDNNLKKNIVLNIIYQVFILILPLVTAPYISRVLSPESIGAYSFIQAFANYFTLFIMMGVNNYGNRIISQVRDDKVQLSKTFWEIYSFQLILAIFVSSVYLLCIVTFINEYRLIYIIQFIYVISAAFDINWLCLGLEKFKSIVIRNTIIKSLNVAAIFIFVNKPSDLALYTLIVASGVLISQIIMWPFVMKQVAFVRLDFKGILRHVKPNLVLFVPVIAISLYNIMDKIMLGMFSTSSEVAYYDYAAKIVEVPITIILALGIVMMPRISNLIATGNEKIGAKLIDKGMFFAILLSSAFAFGLAGIAPVFTPWFYGENFARSGLFILLLSPVIIFKSWAGIIRMQYIIPKQKDSIYILSITSGAVVNLVVNLLLISKFAGIGAIIGTVLAELTVFLIQFIKTSKEINSRTYIKDGLSFGLFGIIMYLIIYKLPDIGLSQVITLLVQISVGIFIYSIFTLIYIVKVKKEYYLINFLLKILKIKEKSGNNKS